MRHVEHSIDAGDGVGDARHRAAAAVLAAGAVTEAAGRVQQAASLAADELVFSVANGTALDTVRLAELLAVTVRAAAEAADAAAAHATQPAGPAEETAGILAAARERDSRAELRDHAADEREKAASLRTFLGDRHEESELHSAGLPVRRAAARDRFDAMTDRVAAAADRARLSDHRSLPGGGSLG